MPLFRIYLLIIAIMFTACNSITNKKQSTRRIVIDDVIAEGNISEDTILNGAIKFFDTATKTLVIEAIYKDEKLNGQRKDYYRNGKIKGIGPYENGKQIGTFSTYDSFGELKSKQDFYYDLRAGSSLEYASGAIKSYYFISFENVELFAINYDTLTNKSINEINDNRFFFFNIKDVDLITTTDYRSEKKRGFIYLVNPPKFNFKYELCVINSMDSILRVEKSFNMTKIWDTFDFDSKTLNEDERYCLRLSYDKEFNEKEREAGQMLKRL